MALSEELRAPNAPGWLLERLDKKLCARASRIAVYDRYYRGEHPLAFASKKFKQAFGGLFEQFADNWCDLVVDAVEERLGVQGFRLGTEVEGDTKAWDMWQANNLDADSQLAHTDALINGISYALVGPGEGKYPEITIEHPNQMFVEFESGSRRKRRAALKKWLDDDGYINATLYLPTEVYKFRSTTKRSTDYIGGALRASSWDVREVDGETWPLAHDFGVVPVVPLANRPRLLVEGVSEIHRIIPMQDAVNKLIADMLVSSEFTAYRQRYSIGLEIPIDPKTGEEVPPFEAGADRLWMAEDKEVQFGEFGETNLENYVKATEMIVQHVASQTRTPPHYFYLSGQFPSGESIKSAETGLVAKARRKMVHFGEGWEEVIRLGFVASGQKKRANVTNTETIWADPESRSESEHIDALVKKLSLGVPREQLWEDAGYTPQQVQRFKAMPRESVTVSIGTGPAPAAADIPAAPVAE